MWVSCLLGFCLLYLFLFQPVLRNWCNKGCGMCYPVCWMVHAKHYMLLIVDHEVVAAGFLCISHSSQCSTIGVTKAVVCVILSVG